MYHKKRREPERGRPTCAETSQDVWASVRTSVALAIAARGENSREVDATWGAGGGSVGQRAESSECLPECLERLQF